MAHKIPSLNRSVARNKIVEHLQLPVRHTRELYFGKLGLIKLPENLFSSGVLKMTPKGNAEFTAKGRKFQSGVTEKGPFRNGATKRTGVITYKTVLNKIEKKVKTGEKTVAINYTLKNITTPFAVLEESPPADKSLVNGVINFLYIDLSQDDSGHYGSWVINE